ncbi:MAG: FMN-binding protein [Christensenellales bacterium]|jgi:electron transport complex protein RnfG
MKDILNLGIRLMVVGLVSAFLLSLTYNATLEPIAQQKELRANAARIAVMPDGGEFQEVLESFDGISAVHKNSAGYVFEILAKGYSTSGVGVTVGILNDGTVSGTRVDASSETPGLGTKAADEDFYSLFDGKGSGDVDEISAISGATVTSSAVKNAVKLALDTFDANYKEGGDSR